MDLLYFALLCSVLVFVHELGHFVCAKIFGVKVLTFSIGFGPKILRIRGRETEYCLALLPLGGFVKMLEENRQETVLPEDKKRTFEAQALYKRVIIVLAGPVMNVLFPILIYFSVFLGNTQSPPATVGVVLAGHPAEGKLEAGDRILEIEGERVTTFAEVQHIVRASPGKELHLKVFRNNAYVDVSVVPEERVIRMPLDLAETVGEIGIKPNRPAAVIGVARPESPAYRAGLRTFDVVTEVRGKAVKSFSDLEAAIQDNRGETVPVTYLRPVKCPGAMGKLADLFVYESGVAALTPESGHGDLLSRTGIEPADLYVADVPEGSAEHNAGLRRGDRVTELDREEIQAWSVLREKLFEAPDRRHRIAWLRAGQPKSGEIQLRREDWIDEYGEHRPRYFFRTENWVPTVPEPAVDNPSSVRFAFTQAVRETYGVVKLIVVGLVRILEGKLSISTLGGPITIYDVVGEEARKGVSYFVWAMAIISINLGLVNLLPIPLLDGGHLLFFGVEAVLRRQVPLRVREIASLVGLLLLLTLMGVAFKNDLERRWDVIRAQVKELVE